MALVRRLLACVLAVSGVAASAQPIVRIEQGLFEQDGAKPQQVALPDTWAQRGVPLDVVGRYRIRFDRTDPASPPSAIIFERLSSHRRIYLNGHLIEAEEPGPVRSNPAHPVAALVDLPPTLLHHGTNELLLEVRYRTRGGLSAGRLGPKAVLREEFERHLLTAVRLPQALNMAAAGLALLLLLLWWRRRDEVAVGAFGGTALLTALRGYTYFLDAAIGSATLGSWLIFLSQIWSVTLFGVFAQAVSGVRWPRVNRIVVGIAALLSVVGFWAISAGHGHALRVAVYPFSFLFACGALGLIVWHARGRGGGVAVLQVLGLTALVAANARDYAVLALDVYPITESFVTPYALPVALIMVSIGLVERIVAALGRVEGINAELEARVAERTRQFEVASSAKTRFLASASHDLRQPLVSIGLLVGLAREQATSPAQRRVLERADESVAAMESLLAGLLDLSRLEGGAVQVRMQAVALRTVWTAIEAHESGIADRKGLRLRFRPTDAVVHSDPVLLERVIRNLVANAIRYTDRGSVLVAARRRAGRICIEVRDSGVGIRGEDHQRIFDEFVQLPTAGGSQGLGLGLTIVRRSLDLLGHRLSLRSAPGQGSCFTITLDASNAQPLAATPRPVTAEPLDGRRIVVLEDDRDVREALCARLQAWGAKVTAFDDLPPLRRWLATTQAAPDLALCDFQLPGGTGLEAVAALRAAHGPSLPAVLITGDTAPADLVRLERAAVPVLHKPYRSEALLGVIVGHLAVRPAPAG